MGQVEEGQIEHDAHPLSRVVAVSVML
jgi:hypothetical protein